MFFSISVIVQSCWIFFRKRLIDDTWKVHKIRNICVDTWHDNMTILAGINKFRIIECKSDYNMYLYHNLCTIRTWCAYTRKFVSFTNLLCRELLANLPCKKCWTAAFILHYISDNIRCKESWSAASSSSGDPKASASIPS